MMKCNDIRELLAGYQDGELDRAQEEMVKKHLSECEQCRTEMARLDKVKEVTSKVQYKDLPLEVWEGYWQSLYRRIERGLGWIFVSIGSIIMAGVGIWLLLQRYFLNPEVGLFNKIGVGALLVGGIFLLVSVIREQVFAYTRERYREVRR